MKLDRFQHDPDALADHFEEALTSLGALCERTWHDRLAVVAEGQAARIWGDEQGLRETELQFLEANGATPRRALDAGTEVFPGCPLTFRLAEALRPAPLNLERLALAAEFDRRAPDAAVAERLWRVQYPNTVRWRLATPFKSAWHFSLAALVRCETQAIDQHWSLHRVVLSLPNGEPDESLAAALWTAQPDSRAMPDWPTPDPSSWTALLSKALESMLAPDLAPVRERQERHLQRELARIDEYFANYEAELKARAGRTRTADANAKIKTRLAATHAEAELRRRDQTARHEIRVVVHVDALLLLAEPSWSARVGYFADHESHEVDSHFISRSRRWHHTQG